MSGQHKTPSYTFYPTGGYAMTTNGIKVPTASARPNFYYQQHINSSGDSNGSSTERKNRDRERGRIPGGNTGKRIRNLSGGGSVGGGRVPLSIPPVPPPMTPTPYFTAHSNLQNLQPIYPPPPPSANLNNGNNLCPNCKGGGVPMMEATKVTNSKLDQGAFWTPINNIQPANNINRDYSLHSFGGFTLNGPDGSQQKHKVTKFCSSHKIALVVSTFSLLVTIGLIITLLLMKKRGMMEH